MSISVELIKEFRNETGFKLGDCKEALEKTNGNKEAAKAYILEKRSNKTENWK